MLARKDGPLLVLGWEPAIRPYVVDALDSYSNGVVVVSGAEITDPVATLLDHCVIPGLYSLPSRHLDEVAEYGQAAEVSGVVTFEDKLALLSAEVAARLGLAGPTPLAVETAMSKLACRIALAKAGVPSTSFAAVPITETAATFEGLTFPVVVKPDALSGSQGVFLVRDRTSFAAAVSQSQELAEAGPLKQGLVVVESYIDGRNVTAELALTDNSEEILAIVDTDFALERIGSIEKFWLKGLNFPSTLDSSLQKEAGLVALAAARACGLRNTLVHVEMRCSASGVRVIEVNPRGAGAFLPEVVQMCAGTPYVAAGFAIASGAELPQPGSTGCPAAAVRFLPVPANWPTDGTVTVSAVRHDWNDSLQANIHRVSLRVRAGGEISARVSSLGYVITTGRDPREACAIADRLVDGFHVEV